MKINLVTKSVPEASPNDQIAKIAASEIFSMLVSSVITPSVIEKENDLRRLVDTFIKYRPYKFEPVFYPIGILGNFKRLWAMTERMSCSMYPLKSGELCLRAEFKAEEGDLIFVLQFDFQVKEKELLVTVVYQVQR